MSGVGQIFRDEQKFDVSELGDYTKNIRFARILTVYDASVLSSASGIRDKYGKIEILFLDNASTVPIEIPFTLPWFSWTRGSGIMFMPEQNDIVACLEQINGYPVIIGFLPYKWDVTLSKPVVIKKDSIGYTRPLYKGEVCIKSSFGGEVLLNSEGTVEISGIDSSYKESIISEIDGNNNEVTFERVLGGNENCVAKTVVGKKYLLGGTPKYVGNAPQIFESGTSSFYNQSINLPYSTSVAFNVTADTEIYEVLNVHINYVDGGITKRIDLLPGQYSLVAENIYTPGSNDEQDVYYKPATTERNTIRYTLTVPQYGYSQCTTTIEYVAKHFVGGVRVNQLGDLFLDGRNVIVRSADEKSTLTLLDSGKATLRGSGTTEIGNVDGGLVSCTAGGVQYGQGIGIDTVSPEHPLTRMTIEAELSPEDVDFGTLFYMSDTLPLIRLYKEGERWEYKAVTAEEYKTLSPATESTVHKICLSPLGFYFTEQKLADMLAEDVPTYGDLKRLG